MLDEVTTLHSAVAKVRRSTAAGEIVGDYLHTLKEHLCKSASLEKAI
jgi:hypothetical protein